MQTIHKNKSFFLYLIIISMAVAPAFALGAGNRNLFLIGVMVLSPLIVLKHHKLYSSDTLLLSFMLSIILIPFIVHPESMRWSTVMYSLMFGVTFIAYKQLLYKKYFTIENYLKLLKYLISAYFIVLLIQQFCVLTGLPIFNVSNYYPVEPWKLNSLSAEPSHSARIMALLMYAYISIKEISIKRTYNFRREIKEDKWVWLGFLWTMFTMGSSTAFLFIGIVLFKFVRLKSLIPLFILLSIAILFVNTMDSHNFERVYKVFMSTLTFDVDAIIHADHSASSRIVPMMVISQMVDFITFNGWFGHGIDSTTIIIHKIYPDFPEGATGGGMLQVWWEYGFLTFILFIWFSLKMTFRKKDMLTLVFCIVPI